MISIKNQILLFAMIGCVAFALAMPNGAVPPDRPSIFGKEYALVTYDVDAPPPFVTSPTFRATLDKAIGKDRWRTTDSNAKFGDDQPVFQMLATDPGRKSPNWVTRGTARKITSSAALPPTEPEAAELIGK